MITLAVNQPYPFPLPGADGAVADFLRQSGNRLLITMPGISEREARVMRTGALHSGMLVGNGAILLLWQFRDKHNKPVITLDSPFDARVIQDINWHNIDNTEQRLVIDAHIVDSDTNIIRGLRAVTMPPTLTLAFFSAVQDQLAAHGGDAQWRIWMQSQPVELFKSIRTHIMGT